MSRVTDKDLETLARLINASLGMPPTLYPTKMGGGQMNAGHYYIDHAYGGVALEQALDGGGVRNVFSRGHIPKRELHHLMHAYLEGIRDMRKLAINWLTK